jgi:hypothetical protein
MGPQVSTRPIPFHPVSISLSASDEYVRPVTPLLRSNNMRYDMTWRIVLELFRVSLSCFALPTLLRELWLLSPANFYNALCCQILSPHLTAEGVKGSTGKARKVSMPSCSLQQVAQHAGASHPPCPVLSCHIMSCPAAPDGICMSRLFSCQNT